MPPGTPKTIHIRYYAMLKERRGQDDETVKTMARTASDLYEELTRMHKFRFPHVKLKMAINDEFQDWNTELIDGDCVAFIPPVSGGSMSQAPSHTSQVENVPFDIRPSTCNL